MRARDAAVAVQALVFPLVDTQARSKLPVLDFVRDVRERSQMALVPVAQLGGRVDRLAFLGERGDFAGPHARTQLADNATEHAVDLIADEARVEPRDVGVHDLVERRLVDAGQPLQGTFARGCEPQLMGHDFHVLGPQQVEEVLLPDVEVGVAAAECIGERTQPHHVHALEFQVELDQAGRCLAVVLGIAGRIDDIWMLQVVRVDFPHPGIVRAFVLVGAERRVERQPLRKRTRDGDAPAGFRDRTDVRGVVSGHAVQSRRVLVDQIAVILRGEGEGPHGPTAIAERQVDAAFDVHRPLLAGKYLHPARSRFGVRPHAHELHGTADVAAAVERALRTLEHLHPLEVAEARRGVREELRIVEVEPDALRIAEGSKASDRDVRESVEAHGQVQVGNLEPDLFEPFEVLPVDVGTRDGRDRLGNLK